LIAPAAQVAALHHLEAQQAHKNQQPYLALNFCIALTGTIPPH
jgi:microcystin-dependent protein